MNDDNLKSDNAMPDSLLAILGKIEQQPQRQDSTAAQLANLHTFANRLGLYDAADAIKAMLPK